MAVKLEDIPVTFVKGGSVSGLVAPDKREFFPACEPRSSQCDIVFVVGPSGSGKGTFANQYAKAFVRQFTEPVQ